MTSSAARTQPDEVRKQVVSDIVNRFLCWRLPDNFSPDGGITVKRPNYAPNVDWALIGTNLLDATQARAMVEYLLDGVAVSPASQADDALRSAYLVARDELHNQFGTHSCRAIWDKLNPTDFAWLAALIARERSIARAASQAEAPQPATPTRERLIVLIRHWWENVIIDGGDETPAELADRILSLFAEPLPTPAAPQSRHDDPQGLRTHLIAGRGAPAAPMLGEVAGKLAEIEKAMKWPRDVIRDAKGIDKGSIAYVCFRAAEDALALLRHSPAQPQWRSEVYNALVSKCGLGFKHAFTNEWTCKWAGACKCKVQVDAVLAVFCAADISKAPGIDP